MIVKNKTKKKKNLNQNNFCTKFIQMTLENIPLILKYLFILNQCVCVCDDHHNKHYKI